MNNIVETNVIVNEREFVSRFPDLHREVRTHLNTQPTIPWDFLEYHEVGGLFTVVYADEENEDWSYYAEGEVGGPIGTWDIGED